MSLYDDLPPASTSGEEKKITSDWASFVKLQNTNKNTNKQILKATTKQMIPNKRLTPSSSNTQVSKKPKPSPVPIHKSEPKIEPQQFVAVKVSNEYDPAVPNNYEDYLRGREKAMRENLASTSSKRNDIAKTIMEKQGWQKGKGEATKKIQKISSFIF